MGKIVQIKCGSCGRSREYRIGSGILHGNLEKIAAEYDESIARKIEIISKEKPFALYDFSYSYAKCNYCREIVSVPVLRMKESKDAFIGCCPMCAGKVKVIEDMEQMQCPVCEAKNMQADIIGRWD